MLVVLDLLAEGVGIPVHQRHYGVVSFLIVDVQVVAADAVAAVAGLVEPKTIAVQLQTLGFLAIANHFFIPALLHRTRVPPLRVPPRLSFSISLKVLLLTWRSLVFGVLLGGLLGGARALAAAIFLVHLIGAVELAGVVLGVLVGRFEDDAILDGILHGVVLLVERQFVLLNRHWRLHVPHLAPKNEIRLVPAHLRIGREGQRRKSHQKTVLMLALRLLYGCFGRQGRVSPESSGLCGECEQLRLRIGTFRAHIICRELFKFNLS